MQVVSPYAAAKEAANGSRLESVRAALQRRIELSGEVWTVDDILKLRGMKETRFRPWQLALSAASWLDRFAASPTDRGATARPMLERKTSYLHELLLNEGRVTMCFVDEARIGSLPTVRYESELSRVPELHCLLQEQLADCVQVLSVGATVDQVRRLGYASGEDPKVNVRCNLFSSLDPDKCRLFGHNILEQVASHLYTANNMPTTEAVFVGSEQSVKDLAEAARTLHSPEEFTTMEQADQGLCIVEATVFPTAF